MTCAKGSSTSWEKGSRPVSITLRYLISGCLLALSLTACGGGPPSAGDPRKGRVTTSWSNCATGHCIYDWKVCVGPDLHVHVTDSEPADFTLKNSPECAS